MSNGLEKSIDVKSGVLSEQAPPEEPRRVAIVCEGVKESFEDTFPGVALKLRNQRKTLENRGFACDVLFVDEGEGAGSKLVRRLPFMDPADWESLSLRGYDCAIFRLPWITGRYISAMKRFRSENGDLLIVLDVPTYPYDQELRSLGKLPMLIKDRWNRGKLKALIDVAVSPARTMEIHDIPALCIPNGIDLESMPPRTGGYGTQALHVVCPASFAAWHGVDRFVEGMAASRELVERRDLILHLAGDGPALSEIKELVARHGLQSHVEFHGRLGKDELGRLYDRCCFAVASLGLHRLDPTLIASTLKTREFLAKGVPFVYSGAVDVFLDEPVNFCFEAPADETPIDIAALIEFVDGLYAREGEAALIARIRAYAEAHVSMDATMGPLIDYINSHVPR